LLDWIAQHDGSYVPSRDARQVSEAFDWPAPFLEALLTSARSRRLLVPAEARRGRPRGTLLISELGRAWLEVRQQQAGAPSADNASRDETLVEMESDASGISLNE